MAPSGSTRVGLGGAAVVGVAFGMARYGYGLTLPHIRRDLGLSELVLGLVGSATFAGFLAGLLNLRLVPPRRPRGREPGPRPAPTSMVRPLLVPGTYAVVFLAACVVYFTYAADVLDRAGLPAAAIPMLYAAIGLSRVVAVTTGAVAGRIGSRQVAALCVATVGVALGLLGLAGSSLVATAVSACDFGPGSMTGSAVLAIWTVELVPERAGAAFTGCLVVGAVSSVAAPAVTGALIPSVGLGPLLVAAAVVSLLTGVALGALRDRQAAGTGHRVAPRAHDAA